MRVRNLLDLECSFARNRVMHATAKIQKLLRLKVFLGIFLRLRVPCRKLLLDGVWKLHEALQVGSRYLRGHAAALSSQKERHEVEHCELSRETFRRWH